MTFRIFCHCCPRQWHSWPGEWVFPVVRWHFLHGAHFISTPLLRSLNPDTLHSGHKASSCSHCCPPGQCHRKLQWKTSYSQTCSSSAPLLPSSPFAPAAEWPPLLRGRRRGWREGPQKTAWCRTPFLWPWALLGGYCGTRLEGSSQHSWTSHCPLEWGCWYWWTHPLCRHFRPRRSGLGMCPLWSGTGKTDSEKSKKATSWETRLIWKTQWNEEPSRSNVKKNCIKGLLFPWLSVVVVVVVVVIWL